MCISLNVKPGISHKLRSIHCQVLFLDRLPSSSPNTLTMLQPPSSVGLNTAHVRTHPNPRPHAAQPGDYRVLCLGERCCRAGEAATPRPKEDAAKQFYRSKPFLQINVIEIKAPKGIIAQMPQSHILGFSS